MKATRRRLLQVLPLSLAAAEAQEPSRQVPLTDERLRLLKPVLAMREPQLKALREFEVDESVGIR